MCEGNIERQKENSFGMIHSTLGSTAVNVPGYIVYLPCEAALCAIRRSYAARRRMGCRRDRREGVGSVGALSTSFLLSWQQYLVPLQSDVPEILP